MKINPAQMQEYAARAVRSVPARRCEKGAIP